MTSSVQCDEKIRVPEMRTMHTKSVFVMLRPALSLF